MVCCAKHSVPTLHTHSFFYRHPSHTRLHSLLPPSVISLSLPLQKIGAYAFLAVGWSSLAWLASVFSDHFLDFMVQNWQFALGYIAVSGLLSFAYVYWQGPISNPRSLTIVQWALQTVALLLICWSFQSNIFCLLAIILLLLLYNFPQRVKDYFRFRW